MPDDSTLNKHVDRGVPTRSVQHVSWLESNVNLAWAIGASACVPLPIVWMCFSENCCLRLTDNRLRHNRPMGGAHHARETDRFGPVHGLAETTLKCDLKSHDIDLNHCLRD